MRHNRMYAQVYIHTCKNIQNNEQIKINNLL